MPFLPLKDLLPRALRTAKITDQVQAAQVLDAAQRVLAQLLPPQAMTGVQVLQLRQGTLTIRVPSSAVANELRLRQGDVLRQLNAQVGLQVLHLHCRPTGEREDYPEA
ncbi:MAG: hypothetical protein G01um101431_48 [Parcubacteria group bacterium Gr01-1014_31]|nr:MAG: hypothetical protein G01um101431_48 [Parcubacteria group bacterium Gr01-1014_31]